VRAVRGARCIGPVFYGRKELKAPMQSPSPRRRQAVLSERLCGEAGAPCREYDLEQTGPDFCHRLCRRSKLHSVEPLTF
jgi:hypothetical protein